jgi:asparagine synthase (glutamine-hydrolysing)
MCGFSGIWNADGRSVDAGKFVAMNTAIRHRGPEDEGYLFADRSSGKMMHCFGDDTIPPLKESLEAINPAFKADRAMGFRRLSIIDLSEHGHQPMSYQNGNLWITLNGEIYNYIEIKQELVKKGYSFKSTSDTEVVLAAYSEWGEDCVNRFNGMWAFAIWDKAKDLLFLSRDRLGVKPLFYFHHQGDLLFCSEIKGIREYLERKLTLSEKKIAEFLIRGEIIVGTSDDTIYEEVKQLMPGSNLIYKAGRIVVRKYWELKLEKQHFSFDENVEKFKELFCQSINYRLRSDVEVGSCLSGGIDSSSIVSFASDKFNKRFHTFSAIWPGYACDESYYIEKVNQQYQCYPNAFTPETNDVFSTIDKLILSQELPLQGSSLLAQWFVMEMAGKKGIKVLLDGQGADEILGGYFSYIPPYQNEMICSLRWNNLYKYRSSLNEKGYTTRQFLSNQRYRFISPFRDAALPANARISNEYRFGTRSQNGYACSNLSRFLKDQIEVSNLPTLLHYEDRNSMAHSVESRVPFLDYKLVEFAVNIPTEQKIHGALTKVILREAMKPYLPPEVYNRKDKIGFSTPIEKSWFTNKSRFYEVAMNYILQSGLLKMDLVDESKIDKTDVLSLYTLARFIDMWK